MSDHHYALKMRQSLAQFERSFLHESEQEQQRREEAVRNAELRTRQRGRARELQRRSVRFYLLTLSLVATAIIVTVIMLATLYVLLV
jgi:hypothetical protein